MTIRSSLSTVALLLTTPISSLGSEATPDTIPVSGTGIEISAAAVTAAPGAMPQVWSFNDCVDWAVANTTDIRRNILDVLQAEQDVYAAKDAWLPTVGFSTSQSYTNYPVP